MLVNRLRLASTNTRHDAAVVAMLAAAAHLMLIVVCCCTIDVPVAAAHRSQHSSAHLPWAGLPAAGDSSSSSSSSVVSAACHTLWRCKNVPRWSQSSNVLCLHLRVVMLERHLWLTCFAATAAAALCLSNASAASSYSRFKADLLCLLCC
jgi:hypothetical protein